MINKNYPFCVTIRIWLTLKDYQLNYIDTETDIEVLFFFPFLGFIIQVIYPSILEI